MKAFAQRNSKAIAAAVVLAAAWLLSALGVNPGVAGVNIDQAEIVRLLVAEVVGVAGVWFSPANRS